MKKILSGDQSRFTVIRRGTMHPRRSANIITRIRPVGFLDRIFDRRPDSLSGRTLGVPNSRPGLNRTFAASGIATTAGTTCWAILQIAGRSMALDCREQSLSPGVNRATSPPASIVTSVRKSTGRQCYEFLKISPDKLTSPGGGRTQSPADRAAIARSPRLAIVVVPAILRRSAAAPTTDVSRTGASQRQFARSSPVTLPEN